MFIIISEIEYSVKLLVKLNETEILNISFHIFERDIDFHVSNLKVLPKFICLYSFGRGFCIFGLKCVNASLG